MQKMERAHQDTRRVFITEYIYNFITTQVINNTPFEISFRIVTFMQFKNINLHYNLIARTALGRGHLELLKYILNIMQRNSITPEYNENFKETDWQISNLLQQETLEYVLKTMEGQNISPCYNSIIVNLASYGRIDLMEHILERMQNRQILPNFAGVPKAAILCGNVQVLQFIIKRMEENDFFLDYNSLAEIANKSADLNYLDTIKYTLEIMQNKNLNPNYSEILSHAVDHESIKVAQYIVEIMKNSNRYISFELLKKIFFNMRSNIVDKAFYADVFNLCVDINQLPGVLSSLLHRAVDQSRTSIVEVLLDKGADINISLHGKHVLEKAAFIKHLPILNLLLQKENFFYAYKATQTCSQRQLIDSLREAKFKQAQGRPTGKHLEEVIYNADNVLFWLSKIEKDANSTLHTAFNNDLHENTRATIINCLKWHHIEDVKNKCGL